MDVLIESTDAQQVEMRTLYDAFCDAGREASSEQIVASVACELLVTIALSTAEDPDEAMRQFQMSLTLMLRQARYGGLNRA